MSEGMHVVSEQIEVGNPNAEQITSIAAVSFPVACEIFLPC